MNISANTSQTVHSNVCMQTFKCLMTFKGQINEYKPNNQCLLETFGKFYINDF